VSEDAPAEDGEELLFAYLEIPPAWAWFNNTQYVDTLSPEAMRAFVDTTHVGYAAAVGGQFRSVIPAVAEPSKLPWSRCILTRNQADYA
jgi:hypothetical protein